MVPGGAGNDVGIMCLAEDVCALVLAGIELVFFPVAVLDSGWE